MTQIQVQVAKRNPRNIGIATSKVGVSISIIISNSKSENHGYKFFKRDLIEVGRVEIRGRQRERDPDEGLTFENRENFRDLTGIMVPIPVPRFGENLIGPILHR